jgi:hypothetical protein
MGAALTARPQACGNPVARCFKPDVLRRSESPELELEGLRLFQVLTFEFRRFKNAQARKPGDLLCRSEAS